MRVKEVYLIRHGQTDWNTLGRWQGQLDVALNDVGRRQAAALAEYSTRLPIGAIYTSDLARAYDTAQPMAAALGLEPVIDQRWRELHIGVFAGLTRPEIEARYPTEYAAFLDDDMGYAPPEGESRLAMQQRGRAAFDDMVQAAQSETVAVMTHGGTIRLLLLSLFPQQQPDLANLKVPNTSLTLLRRQTTGWSIAELIETPHLRSGEGLRPGESGEKNYF